MALPMGRPSQQHFCLAHPLLCVLFKPIPLTGYQEVQITFQISGLGCRVGVHAHPDRCSNLGVGMLQVLAFYFRAALVSGNGGTGGWVVGEEEEDRGRRGNW